MSERERERERERENPLHFLIYLCTMYEQYDKVDKQLPFAWWCILREVFIAYLFYLLCRNQYMNHWLQRNCLLKD